MNKIIILDDHAILREGIKYLINKEVDLYVCAEAERPSQLIPLIIIHQPELVLIDLNMSEGGGFPLLEKIIPLYPHLKTIVLSMHDSSSVVAKCLALGVNAYVTKTRAADELLLGVRAVLAGNRYLSSDVSRYQHAPLPHLSTREIETLKHLLQGKNPKMIATELGISDKTLYAHRTNLMLKLQAKTMVELHEKAMALALL